MWRVLYQSICAPLQVFNRENRAGKMSASVAAVLSTAIMGTVLLPVAFYIANRDRYELSIDAGGILIALCVSVLSWLAVCLLFWALSRAFHNVLSFQKTAAVWGLSYIPNLLCVLLFGVLQVVPGVRITSGVAAFIVGALFILLLVWKAIYYFMFLRFVMEVSLKEFMLTVAASAIVFFGLIYAGALAGIQVPMV